MKSTLSHSTEPERKVGSRAPDRRKAYTHISLQKSGLAAFTLIELIVVIAIILLLVAIVIPVISRGTRSAKVADSMSRMRNIFVSFSLYSVDDPSEMLPSFDKADELIPESIRCSPLRTWSVDCATYRERPMIGSYGYIRGTKSFENDQSYAAFLAKRGIMHTILIDIFVTDHPPAISDGDSPSGVTASSHMSFVMPEKTLRLRGDGSVKLTFEPKRPDGVEMMSWSALFRRDVYFDNEP